MGRPPWAQKRAGIDRSIKLTSFLLMVWVGCKWGCQKSDCLLSRLDLACLDWAHSVFLQEPKNEYLLESLPSLFAIFVGSYKTRQKFRCCPSLTELRMVSSCLFANSHWWIRDGYWLPDQIVPLIPISKSQEESAFTLSTGGQNLWGVGAPEVFFASPTYAWCDHLGSCWKSPKNLLLP